MPSTSHGATPIPAAEPLISELGTALPYLLREQGGLGSSHGQGLCPGRWRVTSPLPCSPGGALCVVSPSFLPPRAGETGRED